MIASELLSLMEKTVFDNYGKVHNELLNKEKLLASTKSDRQPTTSDNIPLNMWKIINAASNKCFMKNVNRNNQMYDV